MDLKFEIVKDIGTAKDLWEEFSPNQTLWDDWDFRYCFYKYFNYELYFYVGHLNNEPIGLLPLQYNSKEKHLEFFGGSYMEDNKLFIKENCQNLIPEFYKNIKMKANLEYITGNDLFTKKLPIEEYKYVYNLSGISTLDQFLDKYFKSDAKKKRKKAEKEIDNIEVLRNNIEDLDLMISLNIKNFEEKSSFLQLYRKKIFKDLLKLNQEIYLLTFLIEGKKEAVCLAIKYKDKFVSLNSGVNKDEFPDLQKCLVLKKIEYALKANCGLFDACVGDYGWKEHWHLEKIPQYKYSSSF